MDITTNSNDTAGPQALRRPREGSMVAGVAAGLAEHFGLDVTLVRIGLVALTLMGGVGVPLYVAGWLLIPEEGSGRSVAADLLEQTWHRPGVQD